MSLFLKTAFNFDRPQQHDINYDTVLTGKPMAKAMRTVEKKFTSHI